MKKTTILFLFLALGACKQGPTKEETQETVQKEMTTTIPKFPEELTKVLNAHGGFGLWKNQRTLRFDLPHPEFTETHTVDLRSRRDRVDNEQFSMGFDGKQVWLWDPHENYQGDAGFYHNLMFYFYAMPFVLADDGIQYGDTDALMFDGKSYPGIRIAYDLGVGASSKDEYFIHYDPETHQMAWLGYTVTYRTGEKSENVKWIRYDNWQSVEGLLLPKSITWYNYEGSKILDARDTVSFENVILEQTAEPDDFYAKPEGAKSVEVKKS
ncbi:MAG: DUF6503 family protein [Allomuricauda sp.]